MYKIEFIPTGHTFELPDITAQELKEKFPDDYKILEKNSSRIYNIIVISLNQANIHDLEC